MAGDDIPLAPKYVGLLGAVYQRAEWNASLVTKFVGAQYQGRNGSSDGANFRVAAYSYTNLSLGRSLDDVLGPLHARVSFQVNNIEGRHPVTDAAGLAASGSQLVNVLAGRNYTLSLSVDL
jgi:hypothetical protein